MDLNLIDQLTLLALDDKKGSIIPDSISFSYAIAGAVILELALEEKVDISHELVRTKDRTKTGDTILDTYFELIQQSKKERKIKSWVDRIGNKAEQIKKDTIEKLIVKRIL
jgi:Golgi phosphoprotein 3